jgi:hypothetical protein
VTGASYLSADQLIDDSCDRSVESADIVNTVDRYLCCEASSNKVGSTVAFQCWDRLKRFLSGIARGGRVLEGTTGSNGSQGCRPTLVFRCRSTSWRRQMGPRTDSLVIARSVLLSMHVRDVNRIGLWVMRWRTGG